MKTTMTILISFAFIMAFNTAQAQQNNLIQENDVMDSTGPYNPVDTVIDANEPDPMVSPPPPNTIPPERPSTAPNTQPEPPGTPHPGTTVDPRIEGSSGYQFNQDDFLKSVGTGGSCYDATCAVVVKK